MAETTLCAHPDATVVFWRVLGQGQKSETDSAVQGCDSARFLNWLCPNLELALERLQDMIREPLEVHLLVIDSVFPLFNPFMNNDIKVPLRQALIQEFHRALLMVAQQTGAVVLLTDQVVKSYQGGIRPTLGLVWSHVPSIRVFIEPQNDETLTAKVDKSVHQLSGSKCILEMN